MSIFPRQRHGWTGIPPGPQVVMGCGGDPGWDAEGTTRGDDQRQADLGKPEQPQQPETSTRGVLPAPPWVIQTLEIDEYLYRLIKDATRRNREIGGILLGERFPDRNTVRVLGFLFPKQRIATPVFCEFDQTWISLARAALLEEDLHPRVTVVGWIHTHPHLSAFLSGTDVRTVDGLQALNPLLLAVVFDPYREEMKAFHVERSTPDVQLSVVRIEIDEQFSAQLKRLEACPQLRRFKRKRMMRAWHERGVPVDPEEPVEHEPDEDPYALLLADVRQSYGASGETSAEAPLREGDVFPGAGVADVGSTGIGESIPHAERPALPRPDSDPTIPMGGQMDAPIDATDEQSPRRDK